MVVGRLLDKKMQVPNFTYAADTAGMPSETQCYAQALAQCLDGNFG